MTIVSLAKFIGSSQIDAGIPFLLKDYLELTVWAECNIRPDKREVIKQDTSKTLQKLGLDEQAWVETVQGFSSQYHSFVGPEEKLKLVCQQQVKKRLRGINICRRLFRSPNPNPA